MSSAARPGATILGPPEKPAKKWGSTKPRVTRTSASMKRRSTRAGTSEPGTRPSVTCAASSSPSCCTTSQPARIPAPNIASSSPGVQARWLPVATSSRTWRPGSSSSSTGTTVRAGNGRVTSQMLTATTAPTGARSRSAGPYAGCAERAPDLRRRVVEGGQASRRQDVGAIRQVDLQPIPTEREIDRLARHGQVLVPADRDRMPAARARGSRRRGRAQAARSRSSTNGAAPVLARPGIRWGSGGEVRGATVTPEARR